MENKNVGWLIIGIGIVLGLIVFMFNVGVKDILDASCTHGPTCTMYDSLSLQTWLSVSIIFILIIIGIFVMNIKPKEKIVIKKEKKKELNLSGLDKLEKDVVEYIRKENGAVFQRTLMENFNMGKVNATRILDKLEAKQIIERKRRGLNNIVVLK